MGKEIEFELFYEDMVQSKRTKEEGLAIICKKHVMDNYHRFKRLDIIQRFLQSR